MQVDRSAWERDVIIAVTTRLRDSTALLDSQGIGVERLSWEGCDPDTALEVVILRRGRRHRRRWRVWKDMSGMFQPVPNPDVVAGQILADVLTMALPRGRDTSSEPDVPASATALPLVGRYGHEGRNGSPTTWSRPGARPRREDSDAMPSNSVLVARSLVVPVLTFASSALVAVSTDHDVARVLAVVIALASVAVGVRDYRRARARANAETPHRSPSV